MRTFLRRVRGLLGLGIFSGAVWAVTGFTLGMVVLVFDPADVGPGEGPLWIAYYFGRSGMVAGMVAGVVLAFAERRRVLASLRGSRLALWGAIGGLTIPWVAAAPQAMLPLFVLLGAGTGVTTWALARRGERLGAGTAPIEPPTLGHGAPRAAMEASPGPMGPPERSALSQESV